MEFFSHVKNVYSEITGDDIELDLSQAIFMIKLLAIKGSVPVSKKAWEIYMKSDKPLKMRYYLQIKFPEELTNACDIATQEMNEENEYLNYFNDITRGRGIRRDKIPTYDERIELYERYFKDKIFDDDIQEKISEWIKPDMVDVNINSNIKEIITEEINDIIHNKYIIENTMPNQQKYLYPKNLNQNMINFMKRFKDRESVETLLNSMRDVYTLGLV
jgi:hypothetical protein